MRIRFVVYYDYLCPWCYNASVRLRRFESSNRDTVDLEWRSFLLRPQPRPGGRSLERFRHYTESWRRPAAEADSGTFRVWESDAGPPSHSVPPHVIAKAAAGISRAAFDAVHDRLLYAYFAANRDITETDTLISVWEDAGLSRTAFPDLADQRLTEAVLEDHRAAVDLGISGVPAVRPADREAHVVGAHPLELYERWLARLLTEKRDVDGSG